MKNSINQYTKLYGVVGNPIGHSLSPIIHNAAFKEKGLNAIYLAFESEDIKGCIEGMNALPINGMSITIPYKTAVIPLLDNVDQLADTIGAVNTVINTKGRLIGYNTDAMGAFSALEEVVATEGKSCIIIGAGGAARAIGYLLKNNNVDIIIANRSKERGLELSRALNCGFINLNEVDNKSPDILINTTPLGMSPQTDLCPVSEHALRKGMVVMDIIYNPMKTRLLLMAEAKGCVTISGLSMFINQAAEQFKLWTGQEAPVAVMKKAAEEALTSPSRDGY
jgi:shikimate dehydrogenase